VFQYGFSLRIWNKPVKFDQIWDIRLFWINNPVFKDVTEGDCPENGFANLDDCLDDMLRYIEECEQYKLDGKCKC
jgi:hypothetical protein